MARMRYHGEEGDGPGGVVGDGHKVDDEGRATHEGGEEGTSSHHLLDPLLTWGGGGVIMEGVIYT